MKYDVYLEHEGKKYSVKELTQLATWPDKKTWTDGILRLEEPCDILPGGYATLVLEPVENLPVQRVPVILPCGTAKPGVKVPYKVVSKKAKPNDSRALLFAAMYGATI